LGLVFVFRFLVLRGTTTDYAKRSTKNQQPNTKNQHGGGSRAAARRR
jgi:hypothetical protein